MRNGKKKKLWLHSCSPSAIPTPKQKGAPKTKSCFPPLNRYIGADWCSLGPSWGQKWSWGALFLKVTFRDHTKPSHPLLSKQDQTKAAASFPTTRTVLNPKSQHYLTQKTPPLVCLPGHLHLIQITLKVKYFLHSHTHLWADLPQPHTNPSSPIFSHCTLKTVMYQIKLIHPSISTQDHSSHLGGKKKTNPKPDKARTPSKEADWINNTLPVVPQKQTPTCEDQRLVLQREPPVRSPQLTTAPFHCQPAAQAGDGSPQWVSHTPVQAILATVR